MSERAQCASCDAVLAPFALACGSCHALVHAERLKALAAEAEAASNPTDALSAWRSALELLPPQSRQAETVRGRIAARVEELDAPDSSWNLSRAGGAVGGAAFVVWKFKAFFLLALTKGKLLLLGLTKWKMMASMFLSLGVYWAAFGWKFAVGLIVSLYVHEMGHVYALQRYGIRASAPMFIPGLGAVVRLEQYPQSPGEEARTGLAGPMWGISAAVAALGIGWTMDWPSWVAIGSVGGWLNLFNLIPVWQLDGARGLKALDRLQRGLLFAATALLYLVTADGILLLIGAVLAWKLWVDRPPEEGNWELWGQFTLVLAIGAAMTTIEVPGL